ncbi:phosphodiesterase [Rhodovulum euryhalinum]|uniref:3',5'-cyclic AMP phosphodiesterase CpdA n=1 Tax=Rhodovulum euryhalinum TaxID=35805 RepID=A0A4R2KNA6_9RHOB|nr:phosphodiesterase [Rhodovulum euryhalinum]TCO74172.1 3',5'-cyclic AMP phosphodiesterase CpdA [Rhodovulum euryhalinum]
MIVAQITDLHLRPEGKPAYRVAETNMLAARAIAALRALTPAPDVVVITGDLTDCGLAEEYALLHRLLAQLPMPVLMVPGNHDRREGLLAAFPGAADGRGFAGFVHDAGPLRLIGLDTLVPGASHGALCAGRLAALDAALSERPDAPTLIFLHHPPFACGIRHMDRIALAEGAAEFARIVAAHPQVERVLAGHHHRPIQARWAGTLAMVAPSVAHQVVLDLTEDGPPAFAMEPPAFLLHVWHGGALVTHQAYVETAPGPFPFVLDPDYPGQSQPG